MSGQGGGGYTTFPPFAGIEPWSPILLPVPRYNFYFAIIGASAVCNRSIPVSASRGLAEVLWIRKLLTEVGFRPKRATQVFCDNKAAIQISENPVQHDRTKHVEIDRHFIKEKLEAGIIELPLVRSEDQLADILTKAVRTGIMQDCLGKLNFGDPTIQLEGELKDAFAGLEKEEAAEKWRDALNEAAGLAGSELKNTLDGCWLIEQNIDL
nr:putative copia-type protein [Tanacetum cinerariifolium]